MGVFTTVVMLLSSGLAQAQGVPAATAGCPRLEGHYRCEGSIFSRHFTQRRDGRGRDIYTLEERDRTRPRDDVRRYEIVADGVRRGLDGVSFARDWCEGGELVTWSWVLGLESTNWYSRDGHGGLIVTSAGAEAGDQNGPDRVVRCEADGP